MGVLWGDLADKVRADGIFLGDSPTESDKMTHLQVRCKHGRLTPDLDTPY